MRNLSLASFSWNEKRYRLSRTIVAVPTVITCVFLYSIYTLAHSICNLYPASSTVLKLLNFIRHNSKEIMGVDPKLKTVTDPRLLFYTSIIYTVVKY